MRTFWILLTLAGCCYAQGSMQLSLAKAVDIALTPEGSSKVALAQQSIRQAETHVEGARASFMPTVDGSVQDRYQTVNLRTFGFNFTFPVPGFSLPGIVGPFNVFDARASVQAPVLDFTTIRKYRSAKAGVNGSKVDADSVRDQVSDQVAQAYLATLRADAGVEAAQANVDLSQALVDLAVSQKDAGTGTGIEVTRAQVQLSNDKQRLTVAQNERRGAGLRLMRAMGLSMSADIQLTDKLNYLKVDTGALEATLDTAKKSRTDLKAQEQHENIARLNQDAVEAERLPSVSSFGDYGTIGANIGIAHPTYELGVTLKVPIFDGNRRDARRQESAVQVQQEKIKTRDLEAQIELDVRLAIDALHSADTQVDTAREGMTLAQNELDQAKRRYQAGVANSLEVTDAQTRLDRARDNQVEALYNHNLARLELATATGTIQEYVHK